MTVTTLEPQALQFTVDISAESLLKTTGWTRPGPSTSKKRCAPTTGWGGTWYRAMSMGWGK